MYTKLSHLDLKKAIASSQHTQRNWDLSKSIPTEDLEAIVEAATQCPSKQNRAFYKVHVITNRDVIEKMHSKTKGQGMYISKEGKLSSQTNSQTLANVLLAFEKNPDGMAIKGHPVYGDTADFTQRDTDMAVGIAAGYVNIVSSLMGYQTGCCLCFNGFEVGKAAGIENEVLLLMGIGYNQEGVNRRSHHKEPEYIFDTNHKQTIPTSYIQ
jgi:nitroreductase